jgi:hypothetical protein
VAIEGENARSKMQKMKDFLKQVNIKFKVVRKVYFDQLDQG